MWESKLDKRKSLVLLILIIVLAIGLRLINIGRDSIWFDEAISYLTANFSINEILNNTTKSAHPPFYYLLLHFWLKLSTNSDITLRFLSVLLNVLLIPVVYLLTLDLFDRRSLALLAALFVAISPFHITYSHELRMYTLLMLLTTLMVWAYWRAIHGRHWGWWLLFFLTALLSIYTHLFSFFALTAIGFYALLTYKNRRALTITILIGLALAILFIPWLSIVAGEAEYSVGSLRPLIQEQGIINNPVKLLITFTFLLFGQSTNLWFSAAVLFLTVSIIIIFILEVFKVRQEEDFSALSLLILLVMCIIGLPVLIYHIRPFFLPERTMAAASPFLIILVVWSVTRKKSPLPYLVFATGIVMLVSSFVYLLSPAQKPPYRETLQFVSDNQEAGDVILHTSDGSYLPALRYVDLPNHVVLAGDPDSRRPISVYQAYGGDVWDRKTAVQAGQRLWVIVALEHSFEWQEAQSQFFADHYILLDEQDIGGIKVYLYDLTKD